jgi:uncharacterized protein (TIGR02265 family)
MRRPSDQYDHSPTARTRALEGAGLGGRVTLTTLPQGGARAELQGYFKPAWMAGLCSGLAERSVSIQRAEATALAGLWTATLELLPPVGLDPDSIPFAALILLNPAVAPGSLRLERYRLSDSGEHGGTLRLELDAEDSLGFLGRILSLLAMHSLFPVSLDIETSAGRVHDSFWLIGVGQASPTPQSRKQLDRMLGSCVVSATPLPAPMLSPRFVEPSWTASLDGPAQLRSVPPDATIAGMFPQALLDAARRGQQTLPSARAHYLPFEFYPAAEHARLLLEAASLLLPDKPLRTALRLFGHAAPQALLSSTLGRVMFGTVHGAHDAIEAMARTYAVNVRPSRAELVSSTASSAVVRLCDVPFFLDSHHVGVFEATMRWAGVRGRVTLSAQSASCADLLCSWG